VLADEVCFWLEREGHVPFLDRDPHHGLAVGEAWEERLYRELRAADATICLITRAYLASMWCHTELGIAKAVGSLLLPVRAEARMDHPLVSAARYQYVDYASDPTAARAELGRRLRRLDAGGGAGWPDDRSPFPGLKSFEADLHRAFFGRHAEVRALTGRLRAWGEAEQGLVAVVGPSGCGKSSLVRAGLLPALMNDRACVVLPVLRPGAEPMAALARALATTAHQLGLGWTVAFIRTQLDRPDGLARLADELLVAGSGPARHRVLVTLDQAEELLTTTPAPVRSAFATLLQEAVVGPVQLVATLRSEYLGAMLAEPALTGLPVTPFPLRPLARELLPQVIEGPARLAGLRVDAELVGRMVGDTESGDALPLLAFTLNQLAAGLSRGDALSAERYDELGGVQGTLASQANAALVAARSKTGRTQAEVLGGLLQLVTVDEQGRPSRRRVDRAGLAEPVQRELDAFVDHRLLKADAEDGRALLEVSHEAVLSGWAPLAQAIRDAAAALRARQTVEQAAADWTQAGRRDAYLWERDRILAATALLAAPLPTGRPPPTLAQPRLLRRRRTVPASREHGLPIDGQVPLSPAGAAFLHAGLQRAEAVQRRARRRRIQAFTVLSVLLALALLAAGMALAQRQTAVRQQRIATARQLVVQAEAARATDPRAALLLGITALRLQSGPETRTSLVNTLTTTHYASALTGHKGPVREVAYAPDSSILASASWDNTVRLWNVGQARPRPLGRPLGHTGQVHEVAFAPVGRTLATGNFEDMTRLYSVADPSRPRRLSRLTGPTDWVYAVAFAPDRGRTLAAGSYKTVRLWDVANPNRPQRLARLTAHTGEVAAVAFAPDRRRTLATGSYDKTVRLWDVADRNRPRLLARLTGHTGAVYGVAFAPDGKTVATAGGDNMVALWDVADRNRPRLLTRLTGYAGSVHGVAFAPNGRSLATGSRDGMVIQWDLPKLNDFRDRPLQHACTLAGRGLSRDEWTRYIAGLPYQNTCPP
jgi:TIR domain/AAA ATPase domain/WD domain, G-beta repeat